MNVEKQPDSAVNGVLRERKAGVGDGDAAKRALREVDVVHAKAGGVDQLQGGEEEEGGGREGGRAHASESADDGGMAG